MKKEIVGHHTKRIFSKDLISTNDSELARKSGKNFSKNGTFHILPQVLNIPNHMVKLGEQSKRWKKHFVNKVFDYNKDLNLVLLAKWTAMDHPLIYPQLQYDLLEQLKQSINQWNVNKGNDEVKSWCRFPIIDKHPFRQLKNKWFC